MSLQERVKDLKRITAEAQNAYAELYDKANEELTQYWGEVGYVKDTEEAREYLKILQICQPLHQIATEYHLEMKDMRKKYKDMQGYLKLANEKVRAFEILYSVYEDDALKLYRKMKERGQVNEEGDLIDSEELTQEGRRLYIEQNLGLYLQRARCWHWTIHDILKDYVEKFDLPDDEAAYYRSALEALNAVGDAVAAAEKQADVQGGPNEW